MKYGGDHLDLNIFLSLRGYGVHLRILGYDISIDRLVLFGWRVISHYQTWRGETWYWMDERLGFERIKNDVRVDGWMIQGPLVRTVQ